MVVLEGGQGKHRWCLETSFGIYFVLVLESQSFKTAVLCRANKTVNLL
jgi:hypothetical protein